MRTEKIGDVNRRSVRLGQDVTKKNAHITMSQTISPAPSPAKRFVPRLQIASDFSFIAGLGRQHPRVG